MPGPAAPSPCGSRDDSPPPTPVPAGQARRSERELQLSRDFGQDLANFSKFLFRALPGRRGGRRVCDGDTGLRPGVRRRPAPAPGPRSPGPAPALPPHSQPGRCARRELEGGGFGRRGANAAVRGGCQARERRPLPRRGAGAGVLRRGRGALTFLALSPDCGHREQPRGPGERLVRCASLGNVSGTRCLRPGPSPLRNETGLPGRPKARMTVDSASGALGGRVAEAPLPREVSQSRSRRWEGGEEPDGYKSVACTPKHGTPAGDRKLRFLQVRQVEGGLRRNAWRVFLENAS